VGKISKGLSVIEAMQKCLITAQMKLGEEKSDGSTAPKLER